MALATMGVVGVGIKNAMKPTPAEEAKQAELLEKFTKQVIEGQTTDSFFDELKRLDDIESCKLLDALKGYNMPIDSLKSFK